MNGADKTTKRTMLIAAGVIFLIAVIWLIVLESGSYTRKVCSRINAFGYAVTPSDLYSKGYGTGTSIGAILDEDLALVKEQSAKCGFSADTEKIGNVELLLWNMDNEKVLVIWLVDREPELVFIENSSTGETFPIG